MPTLITRDYVVSQKRSYGTSSPYHASIIGSLNGDPDRDDAAMLMKHAGRLSKLRVQVAISGASGNATVTLCKKESGGSWATTNLSVTIPNDVPGLYEDNDHSVDFSAEALLCWEIYSNTGTGDWFSIRSIAAQISDQP